MDHACIIEIDKFLAEHNTRLSLGLQLVDNNKRMKARIVIASEKIDKKIRKPALPVIATHCPFCGEKLP